MAIHGFQLSQGALVDDEDAPSIDWNVRPEDEFKRATTVSPCIVIPLATLALLCLYILAWNKDGSFVAYVTNSRDAKAHGSLALEVISSIQIAGLSIVS